MTDQQAWTFVAGLGGVAVGLVCAALGFWLVPWIEDQRAWRRYRRDCAAELKRGPGA